ncbi:unnamed protein product [Lactuca saligna]|uniref:Protein kinase domain-containing protein n=1 Tax=Lactuca saligna TaxID=75948 RepID=A0AA36E6E0_LACSI|nr:unnamed protein product [Lactuca saligna]
MEAFMEEFQHLKIQLEDINSATYNFDMSNIIGKGGFGMVYKGVLSHFKEQNTVAFKRQDRNFGQGDPEFWKEILMLSHYTHKNLITLMGFCDEDGEKILVYEYASRGSLDRHLSSSTLTWRQRLNICVEAATGLCYLHDPKGTQQRVIHRDIKSSNILIDENWNAKISDMGLSKIGPANQQHSFLATNVVGTFGYIDPMYAEKSILTKESDVYSFGVVLFEVLCGKLCFVNNNGHFESLVGMWKKSYKQKNVDAIIFEDLKQHMDPVSLEIFSDIAYQCLQKSREGRPKMLHVLDQLETARRSQDKFEELKQTMDYEEELKMFLSQGISANGDGMQAACLDFRKLKHGCEHYRRRCKLCAPCCNKVFWCHRCHDNYTSALNDPTERHNIVRGDVLQIVCIICNTEQPVDQISDSMVVKTTIIATSVDVATQRRCVVPTLVWRTQQKLNARDAMSISLNRNTQNKIFTLPRRLNPILVTLKVNKIVQPPPPPHMATVGYQVAANHSSRNHSHYLSIPASYLLFSLITTRTNMRISYGSSLTYANSGRDSDYRFQQP